MLTFRLGHPDYREELVLLFMDVKVQGLTTEGKVRAGQDLAIKIIDHYWMRGLTFFYHKIPMFLKYSQSDLVNR